MNRVLIWTGEIESLEDLEKYLGCKIDDTKSYDKTAPFFQELQIETIDRDFLEFTVFEADELEDTIFDHTFAASFAGDAIKTIDSNKLEPNNLVILYEHNGIDLEKLAKLPLSKLKLLGIFGCNAAGCNCSIR